MTYSDFGVWRKGITTKENTYGKSALESPSNAGCNMGDGIGNETDISGIIRRYVLISKTKFILGVENCNTLDLLAS
jgi:hypothetical protein